MAGKHPYYHSYDDRYRSVYSQGGEYWTSDEDEIRDTIRKLQAFLDEWQICPGRDKVVELGCGEGHLAEYLLKLGYTYYGLDVSATALKKARGRVGYLQLTHDPFILGDLVAGRLLAEGTFQAAIDNFCLHMLVVDADRLQYLANLKRALAPGGMAYFHENYAGSPFRGPVTSFDDFVSGSGFEAGVVDERTVYRDGSRLTIRLPRLPCRAQDESGYRSEMEAAGLIVRHFEADGNGHCVIHAGV